MGNGLSKSLLFNQNIKQGEKMGKKSIKYRDLIYFNADKVQSILAQLNKGLIESTIESNQSTHEGNLVTKTGKVLELLGFPINLEGGYKYGRTKGLQQEKSLHDFALTHLIDTLPHTDVSKLVRDSLNQSNDRTFVKVKGAFSIYDYQDFGQTLNNMDIIDKIFNDNTSTNENDDLQSLAEFVKSAYVGLTTVEIKNSKDINFIGAINPEYLRETTRNMIYRYGTSPKGEWEMLCQITKIPSNNSQTIEESFENLNNEIDFKSLDREKTLGNVMNQMVKGFSRINDLFASVSYPNIAVEPIAVYKEIDLK